MAWVPKIALALSVGILAAQQTPVVVDPEDELLSMLQEWRQQKRGNPLTLESTSASEGTADASVRAGGCLINGKPTNPCPYGDTTQRDRRSPVILSAIQPEYPALAAASGIRGRVSVLVTVDENGIPQDSKVISVSARDAGGQLIKDAKKCSVSIRPHCQQWGTGSSLLERRTACRLLRTSYSKSTFLPRINPAGLASRRRGWYARGQFSHGLR